MDNLSITISPTRWKYSAKVGDNEIGSVTLRMDKDGRFSIWDMLVSPEYRRLGVAGKLMAECERGIGAAHWFHNHPPAEVWMRVDADNQPAIHLYHKCGFVITDVVEATSSKPKRLIMERRLA